MPVYKNNNLYPVTWGNISWKPGEEKITAEFLPSQIGLTKTDNVPTPPSPILVSQTITLEAETPQTVEVPYSRRVKISAQTEGKGAATLTIGGKTIPLTPLIGWTSTEIEWGTLGDLSLESVAGATVYLLIERVM